MLPRDLRAPISLGYLLARASDTIADTRGPAAHTRKSLLVRFRGLVHVTNPSDSEIDILAEEVIAEILPKVHHEGEQILLKRLAPCFHWLGDFDGVRRAALTKVLDSIIKAQIGDLDTFGKANRMSLQFVETSKDLVRYADSVAGCVGVFWTDLCLQHDPEFADGTIESMRARGLSYGRGLQLLNIVQDLGDDLKLGRCYLPHEQLLAASWIDGPWTTNQGSIMEVAKFWLDRAEAELRQGIEYVDKIRSRRLKIATVIPALIGARTIRDIRKSQSSYLKNRIKVPRPIVRKIVLKATSRAWTGGGYESLFEDLLRADTISVEEK